MASKNLRDTIWDATVGVLLEKIAVGLYGKATSDADTAVKVDSDGHIQVDVLSDSGTPSEVTPTQITKTVSAVGTPEALAADGTFFQSAILIGKNGARSDNTGIVYLGIGSTNDTQALEINPGEDITIKAPAGQKFDLNDWYLDVLNANDGLIIIYS